MCKFSGSSFLTKCFLLYLSRLGPTEKNTIGVTSGNLLTLNFHKEKTFGVKDLDKDILIYDMQDDENKNG